MAKPWTEQEKEYYRAELIELYIDQNKTINEVGSVLNIKPQTIYDRLKRLDIPINKEKKIRYLNRRSDVTLGTKEKAYAEYVAVLMGKIFGPIATITEGNDGYRTVYIGSVKATQWLQNEGLVFNKVAAQVGTPDWIFQKSYYMKRFLRGFFDTDGSVYELRHGIQISLTNYSLPLLLSLQRMLIALEYSVSAISSHHLYITRIDDVERFFREIAPKNPKHNERFTTFIARYKKIRTGSLVGREVRL